MSIELEEQERPRAAGDEEGDAAAPPAEPDDLEETVITPEVAWAGGFRELWSRRELIFYLIWRDVKVRYRQTAFGLAWALFQPSMMTVVFTIFLGPMAAPPGRGIPYPLYVYSGFLAWSLFSSSIMGAGMSVVASEGLITKVYFPRLIVPLASVGVNVVDFGVALIGMVVLMIRYGIQPGLSVLLLPIWVVLIALAGFGTGTLLAGLNVRYRDFRYIMPVLIQVWMFSTPAIFVQAAEQPGVSIFGSQSIYEKVRLLLLELNPVNSLIVSFRAVAFGGEPPWRQLGLSAVAILLLVAVGCYYFRRVEDSFADVI